VIAALFPKVARAVHPLHRYFVRRMWADPSRVTQETLEGYGAALIRPGVFEHAVKIVRTWRADMAELESAIRELGRIPTLVIWGSKDRVVDPASAERIRQSIPRAQLATVEGAGHLPYEECPESFCHILREYLRTLPAQSRVKGSPHEVT
jgi:pimeloyl-ACP methyl ester carboxylesterase